MIKRNNNILTVGAMILKFKITLLKRFMSILKQRMNERIQ